MPRASSFRCGCALVLVALTFAAPRAQAELVSHHFTGQLTTISNGSGGLLDLTGLFTIGQAVTLDYTIERDTPPEAQDPYTSGYTGAITSLAFAIGSWAGSGTPAYSFTTVLDNEPSPGTKLPQTQAGVYDEYSAQVQGGISAPDIGGSTFQSLTYTLDDVQGTVFSSTALPRVFPDLGAFEGKTLTVLVLDLSQFKSGYVMATLAGVSTPAQPTTWGAVKASYR